MIGALTTLSSCKDPTPDPEPGPDNEPETIYIFKDGATDFALTSDSKGGGTYATKFFQKVAMAYEYDALTRYTYLSGNNAKEIVFGDTDRQISKDLKAAAEAKKTADEDFVWAYGYKDGKLGFYASNDDAYAMAWDEFLAAVCQEDAGTISCDSDLWVVGIKTYAEYQEELKEEQKKADQVLIDASKAEIDKYSSKGFGSIPTFPTKYSAAQVPQPNQSHPRLYVNAETLETVKANLEHSDNKNIYRQLMSEANKAVASSKMPKSKDELKASITDMENLAFAYLVTGSEKYGYRAIALAFNYINGIKGSSLNEIQSTSEASTAIHVFAEVYDWCYGLLSDTQRVKLIAGVCNQVAKDCAAGLGCPPNGEETVVGHGAERNIMRDWLAFAIAVADEQPKIYNYVAGRVANEHVKTPNWYYQSGSHHQGSAYGTTPRLYPNMAADMMMYAATGTRIFSEDIHLDEVVLSAIYRLRPDGESLRIGDDYNQTGSSYGYGHLAQVAFYAGNYYKNETVKSWYKYWSYSPSPGPYEFSRPMYLMFNDPTVGYSTKLQYGLNLVHYNGSPLGAMVARSAWNDKNAWMTYTNIEEAGTDNHDHKDSGCFQIYYKGILAPDAGQYEHNGQNYNSTLYLNYVKQTISKNGLLIRNPNVQGYYITLDSGGQRVGTREDTNAMMTWEEQMASNKVNRAKVLGQGSAVDANGNFVYAYISGDITNAYYTDENSPEANYSTVDLVMRSTMTIATGDPEHPMAFIVYDRITSKDASYKKTFLLHTMEEPTFNGGSVVDAPEGEDAAFTYVSGSNSFYYTNVLGPTGAYKQDNLKDKYNGKLTTTTLLPENPVYRYIGGNGKRFWVNGVNGGKSDVTENPTKHPVGEIGWGRVEISPPVAQLTDSFLNVMYVSDAKDANGNATSNDLVPSTLVQCDTHEGAVTFGNVLMFSKTNTAISSEVKFTASGSGEMNYYVGGLAAGKWLVKVGSGTAKEYTVDAASGLLTFTANVGEEVTITPSALTFKIDYSLSGGAINDTTYSTSFSADETITLPTNVTKDGDSFMGFYMDAAFTTKATAELIQAANSNVTLYARYLPGALVSTDGQAINNRFTTSEFKARENATAIMSYTDHGDGSITYKYYSAVETVSNYGLFKTLDSQPLATHLQKHPGEQKLYELSIEVGLVDGCKLLPFAFNGTNGWNLLIPGTAHSDGKYYAYLAGTGDDQRVAEIPADGSLVTIKIYVDLTTPDNATYYAYNLNNTLKTYTSKFTATTTSQLGRVLIGGQVTNLTAAYKPESYPAAIRLGKFFMKPIMEIPSAT